MKTHSAASLFPLLPEAELQQLANDIRDHGLREPIVLLDDEVLDGRNRLAACEIVGVEPRYERLTADQVKDPLAYVISANLHRRHLSESQRAMVAAKFADLNAEQARQRSLANLQRGKHSSESANLRSRQDDIGKTSAAAGAALAVGSRSVEYAQAVLRHASPELVGRVESGEISVSRAARIAREVTPNDQHKKIVVKRTRPNLRQAVLQVMADGQTRTGHQIAAAVRETGLSDLATNEIHAAISAVASGDRRRLETDGGGGYRLVVGSPEQRAAVELYRDLVCSLDELARLARRNKIKDYPQLQQLARGMRKWVLEAIDAVAREAAETHQVPTYIKSRLMADGPKGSTATPASDVPGHSQERSSATA
jgi:ParB-like chromosome segregation protein Spo0J